MTLLAAIAPVLIGAILGHLFVRWCFSCRKIGHDWECYQNRDPAVETLRVCRRCGHFKLADEVP
jgi:hypothetical protein